MGPPAPIQQKRLALARRPRLVQVQDRPTGYRVAHGATMILPKHQREETRMPTTLTRLAVAVAAGLCIVASTASSSWAQTFPDRPIRFFVPFPAGGSTDAVARAMQPALEKILGQPV